MEHLVFLIAQMDFMMMEHLHAKNVQLNASLAPAPKIAPSVTFLPQAISRTFSRVGVIVLAQTLTILTHPTTVLSVTATAKHVPILQQIASPVSRTATFLYSQSPSV
jgi:hypothetical protein